MEIKSIVFYIVCGLFLQFFIFYFTDYNQCSRSCSPLSGLRILPNKCICYNSTSIPRKYHDQKSYSLIDKNIVCSMEGETADLNERELMKKEIMHSGPCGYCSNQNDIDAMIKTKDNLTDISTKCAFVYLLTFGSSWGVNMVKECMMRDVGFTPGCTDCWVDNMGCSISHCFLTCIKSVLMREPKNVGSELNKCLECDEINCGPRFITCSGANRRKTGIITDIYRPDDQVFNNEEL